MCKQDNPTRGRDVSPGIVCTKSAQNPCLFLIRRGSRLFLWTLTFAHKNKAGQHFIMRLFPPRYFLQGVGFTFCTINSYRRVIASEQVPGLKVSPAACMSPAQLLLFNVPNKGRETFDFDQGFEKHHIYRGRTFSFSLHQGTFQDGNAALSSLSWRWPGVGKLWIGHGLPVATTGKYFILKYNNSWECTTFGLYFEHFVGFLTLLVDLTASLRQMDICLWMIGNFFPFFHFSFLEFKLLLYKGRSSPEQKRINY